MARSNVLLQAIRRRRFRHSSSYWEQRYRTGGDSGAGSYGVLARYKADFLNRYVAEQGVRRVIELGCGDGAQLSLADYPEYIGLDVAPGAIEACIHRFEGDRRKTFLLYSPSHLHDPLGALRGDLVLSLDVVYHLVEDEAFETYMHHLFHWARSTSSMYSSDDDARPSAAAWIKHRNYTAWITRNCPSWELVQHEANPHASSEVFAEFRVFRRRPPDGYTS